VAIGKIGLGHQAISEIDINPVNIDSRGDVIAVDSGVGRGPENHVKEHHVKIN
jgi:hypothetical protein